jgi:hypothetical protein
MWYKTNLGMVAFRSTRLAIGLLVLLCSWAESQQPPEKSGPPVTNRLYSPEPTQKSAANQTGSPTAAQPPIIINVLPTPKSEAEKEDERKEKQEKAESDKKIVELTEALARFTEFLFYATAALGAITLLVVGVGLYQVRLARAALKRRGHV